jgi:phage gp45-like
MEKLAEGQTLLNMLKAANKQLAAAEAVLTSIAGADMMQSGNGGVSVEGGESAASAENVAKSGFAKSALDAQTPMTGYGQRLAERSTPSVE